MLCTNIVLNVKTKTKQNNFCTQQVLNLYFLGNSINNLLSQYGLTGERIRASEKDLLVNHVDHFGLFFKKTGHGVSRRMLSQAAIC